MKSTQAASPRLIGIAPVMSDSAGHHVDYHRCVQDALAQQGWEYELWVPDGLRREDARPGWRRILPPAFSGDRATWRRLAAIPYFLRLERALTHGIRAEGRSRDGSVSLFIESFSAIELLALVLAVRRASERVSHVAIMYRNALPANGLRTQAHRLLLRLLCRGGGPRISLLSDTLVLQDELRAMFGLDVEVLPIPHTGAGESHPPPPSAPATGGRIVCWWPGPPRTVKGLDRILELARDSGPNADRFTLKAAASAGLPSVDGGATVQVLPELLPRQQYEHEFATSELILLPYWPALYREATSGIFVEAVALGKIPVPSEGTWMASELRRYGLERLLDVWGSPQPWTELLTLRNDQVILTQLAAMRASYRTYHCLENFGRVFAGVLESTPHQPVPREHEP